MKPRPENSGLINIENISVKLAKKWINNILLEEVINHLTLFIAPNSVLFCDKPITIDLEALLYILL